MTTTHTPDLLIADCPVCHDRQMAFEAVTATTAQCGGCGAIVAVADLGEPMP
jgi:ribosomal protein S27E